MSFYSNTPGNSTGGLTSVEHDGTLIGDGTIGDPLGLAPLLVDGTSIIGDGISIPFSAVTNPTGKGLRYGGAVWTGVGFDFNVSALGFYIDGVDYTSVATTVTLAASDPTDDRIDIIVVDDTSTVSVVTGTPSTPPVEPTLAWNEVAVALVLVAAGSTQPVILQDLIYNENAGSPTEWVTSTYELGGTMLGSVNFASTNSPYIGSVCAEATATNNRRGMLWTRTSDTNIQNYTFLPFAFRLGSAVPSTKSMNVRFRNSGGTLIGNTVNLFNYGASRSLAGSWQIVIVPVSAFGNITNVRSLTALMAGGTILTTATWSMDFMYLTGGIPPQGNLGPIYLSPSNTLYSSGAANGATAVTDSIFYGTLSGFGATAAYYSIFQGYGSGYSAVSADNSIFIGNKAGFKATNANNSIFQGHWAGYGAVNADNSQFLGTRSGFGASSAYSSSFMGANSGDGALNSYQSVFIGRDAGNGATNASDSFFLGYSAGLNASAASTSAFLGSEAGSGATNAAGSIFVGYQAGKSAVDSISSIFIGQQAGISAANTAPSIAIGALATPGAFNNSIALGTAATSTADNQMTIGSGAFPINQIVVSGTGGIQVPVGTTAERSASQGMIRYNTTTSKFEGYNGTIWVDLN